MARPRRTQSWGQASVLIMICNPACLKLSFWATVSNQLTGMRDQDRSNHLTGMRSQDREGTEPGPGLSTVLTICSDLYGPTLADGGSWEVCICKN